MLSTDQMRAVNFGLGGSSCQWVDMPAGPQPLPEWLKGLHINWMDGWSNSPHITLKVATEARQWPGKVFRKIGPRFLAESGDGRAEQYAHDGAWSWEDRRGCWVTTQQDGFGGDNIKVRLDDGRDLILRGPWHVSPAPGFVEVAYVYPDAPWRGRRRHDDRPWHNTTAMGGLLLTEDLFIRALARFAPHCRLAKVTAGGATTLDPVRPDWDAPKGFKKTTERTAA